MGYFIVVLLQDLEEGATGRGVTRLSVKQAGLVLTDPTKTAPENWMASCVITGHLFAALRGQEDFWTVDHSSCLQEGRTTVREMIILLIEEAFSETIGGSPVQGTRRLKSATKMGAWLTVQPSTVNGTELVAQ